MSRTRCFVLLICLNGRYIYSNKQKKSNKSFQQPLLVLKNVRKSVLFYTRSRIVYCLFLLSCKNKAVSRY